MKRTPLRTRKTLKRLDWFPRSSQPMRKSPFKTSRKKMGISARAAREFAVERSGGTCELKTPVCNGRPTDFHHAMLRSAGGKDDGDNLRWCCHACHMHAHAHPQEALAHGWIISRYPGDAE